MKTIEIIKSDVAFQATLGDIHRMSNEAAQELVEAGIGKYVPKSRWKTEVRDVQKEETVQFTPDAKVVANGVEVIKETKSARIRRKREERRKAQNQ